MATYMLFIREGEIKDAEALKTYSMMNRAKTPDPDAVPPKPLIVYGAQTGFEGEEPNGVVLLEFPDAEAAQAWYNSPDYQAASEFRRKGADYRVVMIEGFAPGA